MKDRKLYFKEYYSRPEVKVRLKKWRNKYEEKNKQRLKQYRKNHYQRNKKEIVARRKEYMDNYRIVNKEKLRANRMKYYLKNKERKSKYNKKYHQLNKESINIRHVNYFHTVDGKMRKKVYKHNRRVLEKGLTLMVVQRVYEENIKRFGTLTCELCGKKVSFGDDSLDHFIPVTRGGSNERENLGVAHKVCNSEKGSKTLDEYKLMVAAN